MVAAAHPAAVRIGVELLRAGGSAVDAAIGVNAALGLMEPTGCGIGGDLMAMVWQASSGRLHALDAAGRSPRSIPAQAAPIPLHSPLAWSVPGAVDGWFALHERFGRLPLEAVLAPSIEAAERGEAVPPVIAGEWQRGARLHRDRPGFAETFMPVPRVGERFANRALARAYRLIADEGRDAFYAGAIADGIAAFSEAHGGYLSRSDLQAHRSRWVEPLSVVYRGVEIFEMPPPGQGLTALQLLQLLDGFELRVDDADSWHLLIEAKKLAFEDRARYLGGGEVPVAALLDPDYARRRAATIEMHRAAERIAPSPLEGDTTYLAVADDAGDMVSLIQSNYTGFGSGYVLPEWGFGLQNRGALFDHRPGRPNSLGPGRRPFHTIIPAFAMRDGEPWLAFGVMGADMQPQGHAQILINLLDFGMDLQQAGDAPRCYHAGSSTPTGTTMRDGGEVHLEPGVPDAIREELARRGHRLVEPVGPFGGYQAVGREDCGWVGASESRKDGCALGF